MSPLNDASAIPAPAGEVPPSASPVIAAASIHCRMSERYDVEGDAEVAASDGSAVFRGRVLNISATGCFVGTVAYIRFTPGTAVDLVFHIDGLDGPKQFQIHAEARVHGPGSASAFASCA